MNTDTTQVKNAAFWLDRACDYEIEGKGKQAEMALKQAIKKDEEENPKSLPRH